MWSPTSKPAPSKQFVPWQAKAGVRLAILHAAIVIVAFCLAGALAKVSMERLSLAAIRSHVSGEMRSLDDEFVQKGASHLPFTVAKRSRLWRGFDYRLSSSSDRLLAGHLPPTGLTSGWTELRVGSGALGRRFLTYSKVMPDGARLSVGQDLIVQVGEMQAVDRALLMCGGLGVMVCLAASYVFATGTWRRVAHLSAAAIDVSCGRLDVRVKTPRRSQPDELDHLGAAFNSMLDQISLLVSQVRQVSTDIAHDLRTPLTRFGQKLEQLRAAAAERPELLVQVDRLETDLQEILRTFDALLQLSQIQAPPETAAIGQIDLGEVVARVAEAYRPDIEESGRRLVVCASSALVAGDKGLVAQCVANLLENALRHTPQGCCIIVRGGASKGGAQLDVEDNGIGIAAEDRARVVKPFVRLDASRRTSGSGLGLSIVAAIAARHAAAFELEDAGPGLRATVRFPQTATAAAAASDQAAFRAAVPAGHPISVQVRTKEKQY